MYCVQNICFKKDESELIFRKEFGLQGMYSETPGFLARFKIRGKESENGSRRGRVFFVKKKTQ